MRTQIRLDWPTHSTPIWYFYYSKLGVAHTFGPRVCACRLHTAPPTNYSIGRSHSSRIRNNLLKYFALSTNNKNTGVGSIWRRSLIAGPCSGQASGDRATSKRGRRRRARREINQLRIPYDSSNNTRTPKVKMYFVYCKMWQKCCTCTTRCCQ